MDKERFCSNPKCQYHKTFVYYGQEWLQQAKYEIEPLKNYHFDEESPGVLHPKSKTINTVVIKRDVVCAYVGGIKTEGFFCEVCLEPLKMMGVI